MKYSYYSNSVPVTGLVSGTEYMFLPAEQSADPMNQGDRLLVHSLAICLAGLGNAGTAINYRVAILRNTPARNAILGNPSRTLLTCQCFRNSDAALVVTEQQQCSISPHLLLDPGEYLTVVKTVDAGTTTSGYASGIASVVPAEEPELAKPQPLRVAGRTHFLFPGGIRI